MSRGAAGARPSPLPPACLLVATLFLFIPSTLYLGNAPEFDVSLPGILAAYLPVAGLSLAALAVLGTVCPRRLRAHYAALLFGIAVAVWVQGNLLVWEQRLLDGRPIDWAAQAWASRVDIAAWTAIVGACLFFARRLANVTPPASIALIAAQAAALAVTLASGRGWSEARRSLTLPPESLVYSSRQNVVHVILDAFQSDVFGEIVEEDGIGADLDGFVWFRNNLGGFPSTFMSIPYILSGRAYANERPPADFLFDALDRSAYYNRLSDLGYEVHLLPSWRVHRCVGRFSSCYSIPEPYDAPRRAMVGNGLVLFDLTLFRSAPTPLKPYVHRDERWLTRSLLTSGRPPGRFFNQLEFMRDYAARIEVTDGPPTYHLLHLLPPHYPVVSDAQCRYVGPLQGTRAEYKEQARCALRILGGLLDSLRAHGIYDRSLIVVQSDHGAGFPVRMRNPPPSNDARRDGVDPRLLSSELAGLAFALLAVKPPGATGPLAVSDAPTTAADAGPTVSRATGGDADEPGPSVFDLKPAASRRRVFQYYRWPHDGWEARSLGPLQEYVVSGDIHDFAAWRLGRVILPASDYEPRPAIDVGTDDGGHQLLSGWSVNETLGDGTTVAWTLGGSATVALRIPRRERVKLTARLIPYQLENEAQRIEVRLDGTTVGHWNVASEERSLRDYEIFLPGAAEAERLGIVEFAFSHCRDAPDGEADVRPLAALFDWIRVEPAS